MNSVFIIDKEKLLLYKGQDSVVTIPEGVTIIGAAAFASNTTMRQVIIPEGVTTIEHDAFARCSLLSALHLPASALHIGENTFARCPSLVSVTLPNGLAAIPDGAFSYCTSLAYIDIPEGVTSIGTSSFEGCIELASIGIPNSLTRVGFGAFSHCEALADTLCMPAVTHVGTGAFAHCYALTYVYMPRIEVIGALAFAHCTLQYLVLPVTLTDIGANAFEKCNTTFWVTANSTAEKLAKTLSPLVTITLPAKGLTEVEFAQALAQSEPPSDITRFLKPQDEFFFDANYEVRVGKKRGRWMPVFFPQIHGLGYSAVTRYYALRHMREAIDFMLDATLGYHLERICNSLNDQKTTAVAIFGELDALKLHSSLTLFAQITGEASIFGRLLKKFFGGDFDQNTLRILRGGEPLYPD